jgi:hypothetical protein
MSMKFAARGKRHDEMFMAQANKLDKIAGLGMGGCEIPGHLGLFFRISFKYRLLQKTSDGIIAGLTLSLKDCRKFQPSSALLKVNRNKVLLASKKPMINIYYGR